MNKKVIGVVVAVVIVIVAAFAVAVSTSKDADNEKNTSSEMTIENTTEAVKEDTTVAESNDESQSSTDAEENTETDTESTEDAAEDGITVDEATQILCDKYGTEDVDTGYPYSYSYQETVEVDGVEYYNFRMTWLVDNDHNSYLTNLFVSTDGAKVYSGASDGNGGWELYYE